MNVLLTCAGRRNYLVEFFRDALGEVGYVYTTDASEDAPAMQEADQAFVLPRVDDEHYIDTLVQLCLDNKISLLVSLNDLELPILAQAKDRFREIGTILAVSPLSVVDTCFDKWKTYQFLRHVGLGTPKTFLTLDEVIQALEAGDISFPVVVKPRWGTASIGIEFANDLDELKIIYGFVQKRVERSLLASVSSTDPTRCVLIQEKLSCSEYGLDVINDLDGDYVCTFARRKLSMRAGETDRAVTVVDEKLNAVGQVLGEQLRHIGNLDCDVFSDGETCYVLEMNPRFGGGYPFSHMAGARIPSALVSWARGDTVDPSWLRIKAGVVAAKCDRLVVKTYAFHKQF